MSRQPKIEFEHSAPLREAQDAMIVVRRNIKRLHFISGGKGYDSMGRRESERCRDKLDELDHWLGGLARALNAGGKRAQALGYGLPEED